MRKLLLWLVMVAAMVAAILGGTAAFLYSRTGADKLPQEAVTFGEQELTSNGWDWTIPVLGDKVSKSYESPTNLTVQKLGTFTDTVPQLVLPGWVTTAQVQLTAPDGTVWAGTQADCNTYTYTQNGEYQLAVTAYHSADSNTPGDPVGWYAYRASFTMAMNPKVTLSAERAPQGSIVAIQLSGILDGEPTVETDLGTVWFRKTASGYMGYLPVTYNAEGGDHTLSLTCGSLNKEIILTVTRTLYDTVDVPAEESAGAEEFRNAIWPLYTTGSSAKLWNGRFEVPSAGAPTMEYGTTQMVDGARSGQSTGITYAAADGEAVTAPQAGNVVFAGTLTLTGGTVVIDHGCGVKSYLYGLEKVDVERGQSVATGDPLGTAGTTHSLIYELRIGSKSVNPQTALDGNSGLQFREYE